MATKVLDHPMAKRNDVTVKVDTEAVRVAKIAASFKNITLAEYISSLIMAHAPHDIDQGHSELSRGVVKPKGRAK